VDYLALRMGDGRGATFRGEAQGLTRPCQLYSLRQQTQANPWRAQGRWHRSANRCFGRSSPKQL